jgi:hypothetical protein
MDQGKSVIAKAPWCARGWAESNVKRSRSPCPKHVRRSASRGVGERGRQQTGEDGLQGRSPVHVVQGGRSQSASCCKSGPLVVHGHEVPFSLPQAVAFPAGTIVRADVLPLLPVGGVEDDTLWQWVGLLALPCLALMPPPSTLRWHRVVSVRIHPWLHACLR